MAFHNCLRDFLPERKQMHYESDERQANGGVSEMAISGRIRFIRIVKENVPVKQYIRPR